MFSNYCWPGFRKTGVLSEVLNNEMCTCNSQKKDMPIYRKGKKHTKEHEPRRALRLPSGQGPPHTALELRAQDTATRRWLQTPAGPRKTPELNPLGDGQLEEFTAHLHGRLAQKGPGKRPNSTHWETVSWRSSLQTFTANLLRRSNVFHFL